jgi:hypothetical protein
MARNRWYLELEGHEFDLEGLAEFLTSGEITVTRRDDGQWYLSGAVFDGLENPSEVRDRSAEVEEILNGAGILFGLEKAKVGSTVLEVTDAGLRKHRILVAEPGKYGLRGRNAAMTGSDGESKENENALAFRKILKLAETNKRVSDALHFLALQPNWWNLYKVFEIVKDDVQDQVYKLVDEKKLRAFTGTAQSPRLLGDEARHASASPKYFGPDEPTSLEEAQRLIRQLVEKWLQQTGA